MGPCTGGAVFRCVPANGDLVAGSVPPYATTVVMIEAPGYVTQTHVIVVPSSGFPLGFVDARMAPGLDVRVSLGPVAAQGGEVPLRIEAVGKLKSVTATSIPPVSRTACLAADRATSITFVESPSRVIGRTTSQNRRRSCTA